MNDQFFEESHKRGLVVIRHDKSQMRAEVRMNVKRLLVLVFFIIIIPILIGIALAIAFSELGYLVISAIMILIAPFTMLELREKLVIDSYGVKTSGVAFPRPCELSWREIHRIDITPIITLGLCILVYTKNDMGKEKLRAIIPTTPDVIQILNYQLANNPLASS